MKNIFQAVDYRYPKPENFDETNPEFDIFKNDQIQHCQAPEIKTFKNIRISTSSVLFNYFKIIRESCISEGNYQKYSRGWCFFFKFIFPKFNFSKKRFLLITDEWTSNYYHWHIFALKRLLVMKEKGLVENALLFLPRKYQRYSFALASLEKFGINKKQIVFLRRKSNIKVKEVTFATTAEWHPAALHKIREILLQAPKKTNLNLGKRIYISREKQDLRFVENEKEVVALLEKYGFKKITTETLSYEEQISICSNAECLISPHGAGLTNLLFMPQNSSVLELTVDLTRFRPFVTEYHRLSSMLDIRYFNQACEMGQNSKIKDCHHASLLVDLTKLEKNLQLMLSNDR